MSLLSRATGQGRENLCKSLSGAGNPSFATILKVVKALGVQLRAAPA
jgi:probable addiction module antidote protein